MSYETIKTEARVKGHVGEWIAAVGVVSSPFWINWLLFAFGIVDPD